MFIEYLSRKRGSLKAWTGKLVMPVVTMGLLVGMTMAGNVQAASSCDVVKSGLVACYPFDGNANDGSSNGNHGTVDGATLTADRFGNANKSYFFDGSSSITVTTPWDKPLTGEVTHSFWFNPSTNLDSSTKRQNLLLSAPPTIQSYYVGSSQGWYGGSGFVFEVWGNFFPPKFYSVPMDFAPNIWHHVIIQVKEFGFARITIDGTTHELEAPNFTFAADPYHATGMKTIMGMVREQFYFNGKIDDVSIYNRALTETEIKELYQLKDSPPKTCEHAVYSATNNIGKLVIPFVDVPLLNLYTHLPTGELAVFSGELKQVGSSMDFSLVSSKLKLVFLTSAHDPCHALYDETQKTLHVPFVDVDKEVYDVKFQHLKDIPLELGVFHLESHKLVE